MYRVRPINRRPGYRSVYDETTKCVTEASVFIDTASINEMALEVKRSEVAGFSPSLLPTAGNRGHGGNSSLSPPSASSGVELAV
jgi:hypothetical protein